MKKNEAYIYLNLIGKRKKIKPKFQVNDFVRDAVLKKTFSNGDTINWSYKLYENREIINDTIPSYRFDNLPELYNEALLKKTVLSMREKK